MGNFEELKSFIMESDARGYICFTTPDGIKAERMDYFTQQSLEKMLSDLDRSRPSILKRVEDSKWVNDYGLVTLLEYYYNKYYELKNEK